ncbi:hypothetical protein LTR12_017002 [Friedmanniomyces endolithicus]|nr:hypothetical protein LTR12_017002 [Friedmanniomyces endolithicus]
MTIPLHERYGKKAYTVHALLAAANTDDFGPKIGNNLLGKEYDHIRQGVNPDIALDPAEFFAATDVFTGTVSTLSYDEARGLLELPLKAADVCDVTSASSQSTMAAQSSANPVPRIEHPLCGDFGDGYVGVDQAPTLEVEVGEGAKEEEEEDEDVHDALQEDKSFVRTAGTQETTLDVPDGWSGFQPSHKIPAKPRKKSVKTRAAMFDDNALGEQE